MCDWGTKSGRHAGGTRGWQGEIMHERYACLHSTVSIAHETKMKQNQHEDSNESVDIPRHGGDTGNQFLPFQQ